LPSETEAEVKAKACSVTEDENEKRAKEFEAKIAEYEEAKKAKAKIFNPQQLLKRAAELHSYDHPVLGLLRYGELTFEDAFEIDKCKTDVEKTEAVAWLMLRKAYPDLPRDFLKRMPLIESALLIDFLTKQPAFLSPGKNSRSGLKATRRRRSSA